DARLDGRRPLRGASEPRAPLRRARVGGGPGRGSRAGARPLDRSRRNVAFTGGVRGDMKRSLVVLVAALALPAAAAAKGPSKAEVTGPGINKAIVVTGAESPGTPLMTFAESSGFFPLVFGQSPDPTLRHRPDGKLGPRYSVVYRVPGP